VNDRYPIRSFRPGACQKCGGDAFLDGSDGPEWRCLQSGRSLLSYLPLQAEAFRSKPDASSRQRTGDEEPGTTKGIEKVDRSEMASENQLSDYLQARLCASRRS